MMLVASISVTGDVSVTFVHSESFALLGVLMEDTAVVSASHCQALL